MTQRPTEGSLPGSLTLSLPQNFDESKIPNREVFKDPQSDMFLIVGKLILPIHVRYCVPSQVISREFQEGNKFCFLHPQISGNVVTNIVKVFYGYNYTINNYKDLQSVLKVLNGLEIELFILQLEKQLLSIVSECDIFFLLNIAYQYQMQQLFNACFKALLSQQFEQMLYNKYEFMHCQFQLFQLVLRMHYRLQEKGKIVGVQREEIQDMIKLYCLTNNYDRRTCLRLWEKYGSQKMKDKIQKLREREEQKNLRQMEEYLKDFENMVINSEQKSHHQNHENIDRVSHFIEDQDVQSKVSLEIEENSPVLKPRDNSPRRNRKFSNDKLGGFLKPPEKKYNGDSRSQNLKQKKDYFGALQQSIEEQKQVHPYSAGNPIEAPNLDDDDEDADQLVGKISVMLDKYKNAYEQHETNFENMRKIQTMKSAIFNEGSDTNFTASRKYNEGIFGRAEGLKNRQLELLPKIGRNVLDTQRLDQSPKLHK